MKKVILSFYCIGAFFFCASCSTAPQEKGAWLLPRGKQMHRVVVQKTESSEAPALFLTFSAVAQLDDAQAHLVALSPVGTTLFAVDDEGMGKDFRFSKLSPLVQKRAEDFRALYRRLRALFWMRATTMTADVRVLATAADGSVQKMIWTLGSYRIQIEVERL